MRDRYKTLPARSPAGDTGTKLSPLARNSPFRRVLPEQGELCTACRTTSGTKLSRHTGLTRSTGTKLSRHAARRAIPVQNSPRSPEIALFGAFYPSRENFVPHAEPLPGQNSPGIRASRAQPVQNSPGTPQSADFGPLSARRESFIPLPPPTSRAGRRKSRTGTPPRPTNAPAPHRAPPTHPPPIPHAIRLHEISTTPRNVAIPTITIQISKYSQGNCMRNY